MTRRRNEASYLCHVEDSALFAGDVVIRIRKEDAPASWYIAVEGTPVARSIHRGDLLEYRPEQDTVHWHPRTSRGERYTKPEQLHPRTMTDKTMAFCKTFV